MELTISYCGINCAECGARKATLANSDELRASTIELWKTQHGIPELPLEAINCTGCRMEGVKFAHCSKCEIRICSSGRGYETCGDCAELLECSIIAPLHQAVPELLLNLQIK